MCFRFVSNDSKENLITVEVTNNKVTRISYFNNSFFSNIIITINNRG